MPWGRAGLDVVVTTDGDRDVFLVFVGASTGLEPAGARFMMRAEPLHYFYPVCRGSEHLIDRCSDPLHTG